MGWLAWPIVPKKLWPPIKYRPKRAITENEHRRIIERETNLERKVFYELCWQIGAAQGDVALLLAEDVDWSGRTLCFNRRKTGQLSQISLGPELEKLLRALPQQGPLFPYLSRVEAKDRATEFRQRCQGLGIKGVTLHSYRYAWAQRAKQLGYPERFAQMALGHGSKAVHRAYARTTEDRIPSLDEFKMRANQQLYEKVIPLQANDSAGIYAGSDKAVSVA